MATEVERLVTLLEARITGYERELKRATQVADRQARGIEQRFSKMNGMLERAFVTSARTINGALGAIGAGISVGAFVNLGRQALELADNLQDTAEQLGISTDALQVFRFAAAETGVEAGKMDQAILKLNTTIGEAASGDEAAQKKFKALGISFTDAAGNARSAEAVLADLADLLQSLPTPAERAAAAAQLLGERAGPRLVALLAKGSQGLRDYSKAAHDAGQVMEKETIDSLARAQREIEKFNTRVIIATGSFLEFMGSLQAGTDTPERLARINKEIENTQKSLADLRDGGVLSDLANTFGAEEGAARRLNELLAERARLIKQLFPAQGHAGKGIQFTPPPKPGSIDLGSSNTGTDKSKDVLADLQAEREALTQTNRERFISAALRRADAEASSEQGKKIAALAGQIFDEAKAIDAQAEAIKRSAEAAAQQDQDRAAAIEAGRELIRTRQDLDKSLEQELASREEMARISGLSVRDQEIELLLIQEINAHRAAGMPLLDEEIAKKRELIAASVDREQAILKETAALQQMQEWAASGLTDAFGQFAESVAAGENAVDSLGEAFRNFAADFLKRIAEMIIQQAILLALQTITGTVGTGAGGGGGGAAPGANPASFGGGGGGGSGIFGMLIGSLFHSGGIAGRGGRGLRVPAAAFMGAPRLHNGNMPGLKSDEVAAILQKGEPVISLPQLRKARQAASQQGGGMQPKFESRIYNLFDEQEVFSRAASTPVGVQALVNVVRGNPSAFRGALGINQSR